SSNKCTEQLDFKEISLKKPRFKDNSSHEKFSLCAVCTGAYSRCSRCFPCLCHQPQGMVRAVFCGDGKNCRRLGKDQKGLCSGSSAALVFCRMLAWSCAFASPHHP